MAKRLKRDYAFYRAALLGVTDREGLLTPGLRSVAKGFKPSDYYNLRDLKAGRWTPAQKRRVTMYVNELHELTAQEKIIVKTRSPARLKHAQMIGGHDKGFHFKVAFVPGTQTSVPVWNKDGTLTIREKGYAKDVSMFDPVALAKSPKREIARAMSVPQLETAQQFILIAGKNNIMRPMSRALVEPEVRALMHKYDGRHALPEDSGNRGDKPSSHHWKQWLHGIRGYTFRVDPRKKQSKAWATELDHNAALRKRRRAARKADYRRRVKIGGKD